MYLEKVFLDLIKSNNLEEIIKLSEKIPFILHRVNIVSMYNSIIKSNNLRILHYIRKNNIKNINMDYVWLLSIAIVDKKNNIFIKILRSYYFNKIYFKLSYVIWSYDICKYFELYDLYIPNIQIKANTKYRSFKMVRFNFRK